MIYTTIDSPVGPLLLGGEGLERLARLHFAAPAAAPATAPDRTAARFGRDGELPATGWRHDPDAFMAARTQLHEYFAGTRRTFELDLDPHGSSFEVSVWTALQTIPYGETRSYGSLSRQLTGEITASRAVGLANGRNPIAIIIPCHRVIGADGSLTGFGGGLDRKRTLLDLEAGQLALL